MAGRQAAIPAARTLHWESCPRPAAAPGMLVLRNRVSLLSPGTELAFWSGTHAALADPAVPWAKYPFRPGYAAVGEIIAIGDGVTGWNLGELVLHPGKHATYAAQAAAQGALRVPAGVAAEHALFARLAQIAWTAVLRARRIPRRCLVLGAGPIGLLAAQQVRNAGAARVVVRDLSKPRLERAAACGVTAIAAGADHDAAVQAALGGPPELVVEATGVPAVAVDALRAVAYGGEVILLGSPRGPATIELYQQVHLRNVSLTGAHEGWLPMTAQPGTAGDRTTIMAEALDDLATGRLRVEPLISHRIAPDALPAAYDGSATDKGAWYGVVVDWA